MPEIPPASVTIREINEIRHLFDAVLSRPRRRLLEIWVDLRTHMRTSEIMARNHITREGLRKIQRKIDDLGWIAVVAELRQKLERLKTVSSEPRVPKGRPRRSTRATVISADKLRNEPVIALVSVVGGSDVQFAVVAVRRHSQKDVSVRTRARSIRSAFSRTLPAQWTRGFVDEWIRLPFAYLKSSFARLQSAERQSESLPKARGVRMSPLAERFPGDWWFVVLCARGCKRSNVLLSLLGDIEPLTLECKGSVADRLEAALYTLRVTQNLRGFLPCLWGFHEAVRNYIPRGPDGLFQWHADEEAVLQELKERVYDFLVRATSGHLFDLTAWARDRIPHSDRFPLMTLQSAKVVDLRKEEKDRPFIVEFKPISEAIWPRVGQMRSCEHNVGSLRSWWRRHPGLAACDYVVRPGKQQRSWMTIPESFLLNPFVSATASQPAALVSVPRQFLMPPSELSIPKM